MKTLGEILSHCTDYLTARGIERPRRESEDLLCDALNLTRMKLYMDFDRPLTEPELAICRQRLIRRSKGEPLAYIHGEVEFQGLALKVTPDVLIPRQETEQLVNLIAEELSREGQPPGVLWDVCCGSGCIGLALQRRLPTWRVNLSDVSGAALTVARYNAQRNELAVTTYQGDLLQPFEGQRADVIVCNPPYISKNDYANLGREVHDFEPALALIGGELGWEYYERLARDLPQFLQAGGRVWLEIGDTQGSELRRLFSAPLWKRAEVIQDWSGRERFFFLEID